MPTPQFEPKVPMPETTKRQSKRHKGRLTPRTPGNTGMGRSTLLSLSYRKTTGCIIADEATERRLSTTGPSTSTRYAGYNFIWGEIPQDPNISPNPA